MNENLAIVLFAAGASFFASVQIGPVNHAVIQAVLIRGFKQGIRLGLGGALPEFLYAFIAVHFSAFLLDLPYLKEIFSLILICLLPFLAIRSLRDRDYPDTRIKSEQGYFTKGLILGILNPQLIILWIFVLLYAETHSVFLLDSPVQRFLFVMSSVLGAFLLQLTVAVIITRYRNTSIFSKTNFVRRLFAGLFILLALMELFHWLFGTPG
jgi:threonine/homoserine/homoserine lactone efflux protein